MNLFRILGPPGDFIKNRDFFPHPFCMGAQPFCMGTRKSENRQKSGKIGVVLEIGGNEWPTLGLLSTIYSDF
jgi:hypothetical protein